MELDDLLPALAGIRSAMLLASQDINRGDVQARVLISANTRGASFEFTLFFSQMLSTAATFLNENIRSAADIVNSIFGENGLVSADFLLRIRKSTTTAKRRNACVPFAAAFLCLWGSWERWRTSAASDVAASRGRRLLTATKTLTPLRRDGALLCSFRRGDRLWKMRDC
jgi:hypothetical protein